MGQKQESALTVVPTSQEERKEVHAAGAVTTRFSLECILGHSLCLSCWTAPGRLRPWPGRTTNDGRSFGTAQADCPTYWLENLAAANLRREKLAGRFRFIWEFLEHGSTSYFRPEAPYLTTQAGRAYDYMCQRCGDTMRLVRNLLCEVEWKLLAVFPNWLWKSYGYRVVTPTEQAAYNLTTHLNPDIVLFGRIKEKALKDIGESAEFLDASDENLTPRDIWTCHHRSLDKLEDFENRLIELEGQETTAIIATVLPNACAFYYLMSEYSKGASTCDSSMLHIQLANKGAFQVATLAREAVTWHFKFEDVVLVTLDIVSLARSPCQGVHQTRSTRSLVVHRAAELRPPRRRLAPRVLVQQARRPAIYEPEDFHRPRQSDGMLESRRKQPSSSRVCLSVDGHLRHRLRHLSTQGLDHRNGTQALHRVSAPEVYRPWPEPRCGPQSHWPVCSLGQVPRRKQ